MTPPKRHLVTHMGHDGPWLLSKTNKEIRERREYIRTDKPEHERALRLRLLKVVKAPLPPQLAKAYAAWAKADAALVKAYAAWVKAYAAWVKADDAWAKAYAARVKADVARAKADAAWAKADAAWAKAINSPRGVKFHAQVCGCAWTPEQLDILRQLTPP